MDNSICYCLNKDMASDKGSDALERTSNTLCDVCDDTAWLILRLCTCARMSTNHEDTDSKKN